MSRKRIAEVEESEEVEAAARGRLLESARRVLLAGIGAVALAQDEAEEFVQRLVERGEIAEKDARRLIMEVAEKRTHRAEKELDKRVEEILERLNIPTKGDLEQLTHKISALTHKMDELKKTQP